MSLFFFVYTIALLLVCMVTASICLAAYLVSHRVRYIPQGLFFVFYFLELASIFGSEWMAQNVGSIDASNYYAVDNPMLRIALGTFILVSFWVVVLEMIDVTRPLYAFGAGAAFALAQGLVLTLGSYGPGTQWLFYSLRQLFLLTCLGYAYRAFRTTKDEVMRQRLARRKTMFVVLLALVGCILVEDTYVILIASVPDDHSAFVGLFLSSRNFSENVMMVYLAYVVCKPAIEMLRLRFNEPPAMPGSGREAAGPLIDHIEERLPGYAAAHGLSRREREILSLALEGRSNREIASELTLAEGTIKTHLHNIMRKCAVANRDELRQSFWAS